MIVLCKSSSTVYDRKNEWETDKIDDQLQHFNRFSVQKR
jgi:hypothetical protein